MVNVNTKANQMAMVLVRSNYLQLKCQLRCPHANNRCKHFAEKTI